MGKTFKLVRYYLILFIGLIGTSWLIWSRFLRERIIRDIPDGLFTEYRFWVLLYICFIYLIAIKGLIKYKTLNPVILFIIEKVYIPFITLDHAIKHNKLIKNTYDKFITQFIKYFCNLSRNQLVGLIFVLQIVPRIILVSFLLGDVFYFYKLEIFYKVVLIGILPLLFRYLDYTLKDILEYWIKELELYYSWVVVLEEGYEYDSDREDNTAAIYHKKKKSIREYIDIKYENTVLYLYDKVEYEYVASVFCTEDYYYQYSIEQYGNPNAKLGQKNYKDMKKLFETLLPLIIELKRYSATFNEIKDEKYFKYSKVVIFLSYFLCWFFVLTISYYCYPIKFDLFKHFLENLMLYLLQCTYDVFNEGLFHSRNKNQFTFKNIKAILLNIWEKLHR